MNRPHHMQMSPFILSDNMSGLWAYGILELRGHRPGVRAAHPHLPAELPRVRQLDAALHLGDHGAAGDQTQASIGLRICVFPWLVLDHVFLNHVFFGSVPSWF